MGPVAQSDGHDAPGLVDELVPGVAAVVDDVVVRFEHAVGEPVFAQELPDVLLRVQLRAFGGQRQNGDVVRNVELGGHVPAGLIEHQHGVGAGRDALGDFRQVQVHRIGVAFRQDERGALAVLRGDRAEDVGRSRALILGRRGARAAFRPAPGDLVLLADAGLVAKPNLYVARRDPFFAGDLLQAGREAFLKSSIAPAACA